MDFRRFTMASSLVSAGALVMIIPKLLKRSSLKD